MSLETILTAARLAQSLDLTPPDGADGSRRFERMTVLDQAGPGDISFVSAHRYLDQLAETKAGMLLVPAEMEADARAKLPDSWDGVLLVVPEIWAAVVHILEFFTPPPRAEGEVHQSAVVDPSTKLGDPVDIGPNAVIGERCVIEPGAVISAGVVIGNDVSVGANTVILPNAVLHDRTEVGARCTIGQGVVLGSAGFKYEKIAGVRTHIPQVGRVVIEDDVEIGANTTIDRASFAETRVGARTKIDNLVQIGHNVTIGHDTVLCAQVGIAGSVSVGANVIMAGQVGIADNVAIGDNVVLLGQTGVGQDLDKPGLYMGSPCTPRREHHRSWSEFKRLPELRTKLAELERRMKSDSEGAEG